VRFLLDSVQLCPFSLPWLSALCHLLRPGSTALRPETPFGHIELRQLLPTRVGPRPSLSSRRRQTLPSNRRSPARVRLRSPSCASPSGARTRRRVTVRFLRSSCHRALTRCLHSRLHIAPRTLSRNCHLPCWNGSSPSFVLTRPTRAMRHARAAPLMMGARFAT
jgi:hypothetical protein